MLTLKSSHRPDGKIDLSISNLIFDDECCLDLPVWSTCHLRLKHQISHRPDGKIADALASTLACASANASVNSSGYVPQRPSKVPIAPVGKMLTRLLFDSRLHNCERRFGQLCRRCVPQRPRKFPSPRWENTLLTCPFRISSLMTGAASIYQSGVRAICALKFPSTRWENG